MVVVECLDQGEEPSVDTIKKCLRKGTLNLEFVPVLTGTAFKNKGVQPLLDAVVDFMPSPIEVEAIKGVSVREKERDGPWRWLATLRLCERVDVLFAEKVWHELSTCVPSRPLLAVFVAQGSCVFSVHTTNTSWYPILSRSRRGLGCCGAIFI